MKNLLVFLLTLFFVENSTSFHIACTFGIISYNQLENAYSCHVMQIITSSEHTITAVSGSHYPGMSNDNVTLLQFTDNYQLTFVPRGGSNFFPNLHAMFLQRTAILTLFGDEFDDFPRLSWLAFESTRLITISSRLFEKTPEISSVFFFNNNIEFVGRDLFSPVDLAQLKWVSFQQNKCIDEGGSTLEDILRVIVKLWQQCPYDGEFPPTDTTETSSLASTTTSGPVCWEGSIEVAVCYLSDRVETLEHLVGELDSKVSEEKAMTRERFEETNGELARVREELAAAQTRLLSMEKQLEETRSELEQAKESIGEEMQFIRDELLRMSTSPCACTKGTEVHQSFSANQNK